MPNPKEGRGEKKGGEGRDDGREDVSLKWHLVNEVTQGRNCTVESPYPLLTAESVKRPYASVSTDAKNTPPAHKLSCSPSPCPEPFPFSPPWVVNYKARSSSKTNAMGFDGILSGFPD